MASRLDRGARVSPTMSLNVTEQGEDKCHLADRDQKQGWAASSARGYSFSEIRRRLNQISHRRNPDIGAQSMKMLDGLVV